jgi:hypothetical protein
MVRVIQNISDPSQGPARRLAAWLRTPHQALEPDADPRTGDTMKTITELTIAAVAVALLVAAAVQINHAQASSPTPVVQDVH